MSAYFLVAFAASAMFGASLLAVNVDSIKSGLCWPDPEGDDTVSKLPPRSTDIS